MDGENDLDNQFIKYEFKEASDDGYSHLPPFDPAEYSEFVEDFDMTEEQKNEFLLALWHIMAAFVDLGFGVNSIQNIIPGLAQLSENCEIQETGDNNEDDFNGAAGNEALEGEQSP